MLGGGGGIAIVCIYVLHVNLNQRNKICLNQPRKTCPCLTERLLMGRKESNQTKSN